jgi:hypothetical protein
MSLRNFINWRISITRLGPARWSLMAVLVDMEFSWHGIGSRADVERIAQHFLATAGEPAQPARPAQMQLELV